jgi:hypothetical protein
MIYIKRLLQTLRYGYNDWKKILGGKAFDFKEVLPIPDEFYPMIKQRLGGKEALDIQKSKQEPCVWEFRVGKEGVYYTPLALYFLNIKVTWSLDDQKWLRDEMKSLDATSEVMVSLSEKGKRFVGRVNLVDEDYTMTIPDLISIIYEPSYILRGL